MSALLVEPLDDLEVIDEQPITLIETMTLTPLREGIEEILRDTRYVAYEAVIDRVVTYIERERLHEQLHWRSVAFGLIVIHLVGILGGERRP